MVRRGFVVETLSVGLLVAVFLIAGLAALILAGGFERATPVGGLCGFAVKARNAQLAGAIGVIIANNAANVGPPGMGGTDYGRRPSRSSSQVPKALGNAPSPGSSARSSSYRC